MNKIKNIIKWFENFDNKNINYDIIYIYFQILTKKGGGAYGFKTIRKRNKRVWK